MAFRYCLQRSRELASAALAVSGYRAECANKHMRVLECLEFTSNRIEAWKSFLWDVTSEPPIVGWLSGSG